MNRIEIWQIEGTLFPDTSQISILFMIQYKEKIR